MPMTSDEALEQFLLIAADSLIDPPTEFLDKVAKISFTANQQLPYISSSVKVASLNNYPRSGYLNVAADSAATQKNFEDFHATSELELEGEFATQKTCYLSELIDVCLLSNQLLFPRHNWKRLFEFNREIEMGRWKQPATYDLPTSQVLYHAPTGTPTLVVASAASPNWGHFLLEDLPRVVRFIRLSNSQSVRIFATDYNNLNDGVNQRKTELIQKLFPHRNIEITFAKHFEQHHFSKVQYMTPMAIHPRYHAPEFFDEIHNQLLHSANIRGISDSDYPENLLILRKQRRKLETESESALVEHLSLKGFVTIYPEELDGYSQALHFMHAKKIVGIAGAAMANTIFCRKNTSIVHLFPDSWENLLYRDLANIRQHKFNAYYGTSQKDDTLRERNQDFAVNAEKLLDFIETCFANQQKH